MFARPKSTIRKNKILNNKDKKILAKSIKDLTSQSNNSVTLNKLIARLENETNSQIRPKIPSRSKSVNSTTNIKIPDGLSTDQANDQGMIQNKIIQNILDIPQFEDSQINLINNNEAILANIYKSNDEEAINKMDINYQSTINDNLENDNNINSQSTNTQMDNS